MIDNNNLLNDLVIFVEDVRRSNKNRDFLSDFEEGCIEGREDVIDDLERIINKYKN